ncbi:MAG: hypothetical protein HC837_21485, partial [Chloroflexaceae bacterium]|nr:hypothetical protein [Chloroflexaceae bacterium]
MIVSETSQTARRRLWHEVGLHLLLLVLVLVATLAGYNHTLPTIVSANSDDQQLFVDFYAEEENATDIYRWTSGASSICLPQTGQVPLRLARLVVLGDGAHALGINQLDLLVNTQPLVTVDLRPARQHITVLIGPQGQPADDVCFGLQSEAVRPAAELRELGVPFQLLRLQRVAAGGPAWPALVQLALNLLLALLVFWLLRLLSIPAVWAALLVALPTIGLGWATATGTIAAGVNVTRDLLPLV